MQSALPIGSNAPPSSEAKKNSGPESAGAALTAQAPWPDRPARGLWTPVLLDRNPQDWRFELDWKNVHIKDVKTKGAEPTNPAKKPTKSP